MYDCLIENSSILNSNCNSGRILKTKNKLSKMPLIFVGSGNREKETNQDNYMLGLHNAILKDKVNCQTDYSEYNFNYNTRSIDLEKMIMAKRAKEKLSNFVHKIKMVQVPSSNDLSKFNSAKYLNLQYEKFNNPIDEIKSKMKKRNLNKVELIEILQEKMNKQEVIKNVNKQFHKFIFNDTVYVSNGESCRIHLKSRNKDNCNTNSKSNSKINYPDTFISCKMNTKKNSNLFTKTSTQAYYTMNKNKSSSQIKFKEKIQIPKLCLISNGSLIDLKGKIKNTNKTERNETWSTSTSSKTLRQINVKNKDQVFQKQDINFNKQFINTYDRNKKIDLNLTSSFYRDIYTYKKTIEIYDSNKDPLANFYNEVNNKSRYINRIFNIK